MTHKFTESGYSLVELMISIVLGMLVVGGAILIYTSSFASNSNTLRMARVNNDLRTAMTFITRDLKRTGHWSNAVGDAPSFTDTENQHKTITLGSAFTDTDGITKYRSIEFSYDLNSTTAKETNEDFGYRYDSTEKAIETKMGAGGWENLSDPAVVEITDFKITDSSFNLPMSGGHSINTYEYTFEITGRLIKDISITRTLRETVRIRNEIVL
jgi:Tfp pilus assembly protein PilW